MSKRSVKTTWMVFCKIEISKKCRGVFISTKKHTVKCCPVCKRIIARNIKVGIKVMQKMVESKRYRHEIKYNNINDIEMKQIENRPILDIDGKKVRDMENVGTYITSKKEIEIGYKNGMKTLKRYQEELKARQDKLDAAGQKPVMSNEMRKIADNIDKLNKFKEISQYENQVKEAQKGVEFQQERVAEFLRTLKQIEDIYEKEKK